jgi:hypothetical protein
VEVRWRTNQRDATPRTALFFTPEDCDEKSGRYPRMDAGLTEMDAENIDEFVRFASKLELSSCGS